MTQLNIEKNFQINLGVRFGTAVFIVEGEKDEFSLFKHIFCDILGCGFISKRRNKDFLELISEDTRNTVIVFNVRTSNIISVRECSYRNKIFQDIFEKYNIDLTNKPVFYIWDRDKDSNPKDRIRQAIELMVDPYQNEGVNGGGMLLLSYPNLEAYKVDLANLEPNNKDRENLKKFLSLKRRRGTAHIDETALINAALRMNNGLRELGIEEYNLNNFRDSSLGIFDAEEEALSEKGYYKMLSLISMALIYIGVLRVVD